MLQKLTIKNLATIENESIQFKQGLNILSGETGAGKSIVLEAISLLLGSRGSSDLVRKDSENCIVEGTFLVDRTKERIEALQDLGVDFDDQELVIRRVISKSGKSKCFINSFQVNLGQLQTVSEGLVDLCSQHEHQSLGKASFQLSMIDQYAGSVELAEKCKTVFQEYHDSFLKLESLKSKDKERAQKLDFLEFQQKELKDADFKACEEEELQKEKILLQSSEKRAKLSQDVVSMFESEEYGALESLKKITRKLSELSELDSSLQTLSETLELKITEIEEAALDLRRYGDSIEFQEERLEEIRDRLSLLSNLKRKHGSSLEEILSRKEEIDRELSELQGYDEQIETLESNLSKYEKVLKKEGDKLSEKRSQVLKKLNSEITKELHELKMEGSKFEFRLHTHKNLSEWNHHSPQDPEIMIQTNPGEGLKPLAKVASGGELSRIMLSLRRVISSSGGIGVYLFDEIDAGMGGQTAFLVGKKLKSVSKNNQVICITHLPQVAAYSDHHIVVLKALDGKRTFTKMITLDQKGKKEELARMLGGAGLTRKSLENAQDLLNSAK